VSWPESPQHRRHPRHRRDDRTDEGSVVDAIPVMRSAPAPRHDADDRMPPPDGGDDGSGARSPQRRGATERRSPARQGFSGAISSPPTRRAKCLQTSVYDGRLPCQGGARAGRAGGANAIDDRSLAPWIFDFDNDRSSGLLTDAGSTTRSRTVRRGVKPRPTEHPLRAAVPLPPTR
jgi:hypothetical protein